MFTGMSEGNLRPVVGKRQEVTGIQGTGMIVVKNTQSVSPVNAERCEQSRLYFWNSQNPAPCRRQKDSFHVIPEQTKHQHNKQSVWRS
jgi:hypothetical protein